MATKTAKPPLQKSAPSGNIAASLQVSLPQMLDLALGTPEVGAVNLNILHNFLHVVLYQINLRTTKVEYRGDDASRIKTMVASLKAGPSLHLHEYSITDGSGRVKQRIHSTDNLTVNVDVYTDADPNAKPGKGASSAPSTARGTKSKPDLDTATGAKKIKGVKQQIGGGIEGDFESVIFVEPILDGATPTALGFKKLENSVQKLQQQFQVLEELAANPELIEKVRGNSTDPLKDMWQIININKRLDASEQGINKLTSMLQDLIKGDKIEIQGGPDVSSELAEIDQRLADLETNFALLYGEDNSSPPQTQATSGGGKTGAASESKKTVATLVEPNTEEKEIGSEDLTENKPSARTIATEKSEVGGGGKGGGGTSAKASAIKSGKVAKKPSITVDLNEIRGDVTSLKKDITEVRKDIEDLQSKIKELPTQAAGAPSSEATKPGTAGSKKGGTGGGKKAGPGTGGKNKEQTGSTTEGKEETGKTSVGEKTETGAEEKAGPPASGNTTFRSEASTEPENETNDEKLNRCLETVQNVETMYADAIHELNNRVQELEKDVARLMETTNNTPMGGVGSEGGQVINELHTKIQNIQAEMEKLNQITKKMTADKENMNTNTNALQEQIELLKTVKADKEDLEDALADKADAKAVNRKVSYDQFDSTCDDLTRGLEEAIGKLSQQESVWQQSLDEVQREIGSKLDKVEISPLKEFFESKLKALQEKLKALSDMRQQNEAAGTKKMLRDVQCLSCDKNVVMRMEENATIHAPPMPCTKSIKPYLTYELDQIRKQQRQLPQSRNMLQFEAALQEGRKLKKKEAPLAKSSRDHLCNRYCGGSHTIITPQQKVMRIGHFINEWGPQVLQLSEGFIEGSDGQVYRSRLMVNQSDGKKPIICDPCDNKCNIQRTSKENLAPDSNRVREAGAKKASSVFVGPGEKVATKSSMRTNQKVSREPSEIPLLEEQAPPPPSPPSREQSLMKNASQQQSQNPDRTIGAGSFFEEAKPLAKILFEEDEEMEG